MNLKKILIIVICLLLIFVLTDFLLCKNNKEPIFCIKGDMLWDGGSYQCTGAFYKINVHKQVDGKIGKTEFGTWNLAFE